MKPQPKRLLLLISGVALLLLIPFITMNFSDTVDWKLSDFIIMGTLLLSTALGIELILRKITQPVPRLVLILGTLLLLLVLWAELAVGVFGTPFAGS
ncbi:hypothetical protein [Aquimarina brevivitae]|uniref:Uncharacterized protein n=1 Tax=Aquimarina brevivitae TaxID=323412 RepID=A0A4Q7P190_9FLAO|nr:hypothetical protein [Aquimarina brevivitae]RZS93593.1 hypothetical protein EV197_2173 [Aquimarina brevivitae]